MSTIKEPLADARDMAPAHRMFRREFGLMPGLVRAVAVGDRDRTTLVAGHIALLISVLDHHHQGEDQYVWPLLRERCSEECARLVDVMEKQHQTIHKSLAQVEQAVAAWQDSPSAETRDAVGDAVGRLLPGMEEHLALEEQRVVPLIEEYLTDAEYSRVAQEQGAEIPPEKLPAVFGMFMYETTPEVVDMVVSHMPSEVQPIIRDLGAQAYADYAKELYGTATPARVDGWPLANA